MCLLKPVRRPELEWVEQHDAAQSSMASEAARSPRLDGHLSCLFRRARIVLVDGSAAATREKTNALTGPKYPKAASGRRAEESYCQGVKSILRDSLLGTGGRARPATRPYPSWGIGQVSSQTPRCLAYSVPGLGRPSDVEHTRGRFTLDRSGAVGGPTSRLHVMIDAVPLPAKLRSKAVAVALWIDQGRRGMFRKRENSSIRVSRAARVGSHPLLSCAAAA